jgi:hypothetical protein
MKQVNQKHNFSFTAQIFKEGEVFVAYVPALDVSSCAGTDEGARKNIQDAVRGFLESSADRGTLHEILSEGGYELEGGQWLAPEFVSVDRLAVNF